MTLARALPLRTVDHYDLDDGDLTHPIFIDYVIPADSLAFYKATLSWKIRGFRSTANLNPSAVGAGAAHKHGITVSGLAQSPAGVALGQDVNGNYTASNDANTTTKVAGAFGPGTDNESTHTHSLTGSSAQAVTDGAIAGTVSALLVDGVDFTSALGGPWATLEVVELNISSQFRIETGRWHTLTLQLTDLARVVSLMRLYHST